jgi:hypothetical protein
MAVGESLMPYIVTSQESELLRKRLMRQGVRMRVDLVLKERSKSYLDANLFLEHVNTIFVPYHTDLRMTEKFEAHGTVLLMDNCSSHTSDNVIAILTKESVKIITFSSHTTHIFQIFDVVLFKALKKYATGLATFEEEQTIAAFIIKVYHDFKQTMIEVNIWGCSEPLGSFIASTNFRTNCSSMRKNPGKVPGSSSYGSAMFS